MQFTQYIDDSGTDPAQHVAIATALVIPASTVEKFVGEWKTAKGKHGFSCFHMAEFAARNPKSEFADWDETKRQKLLARVLQVTKKYGVQAYSYAVNKVDFDSEVPKSFRIATGALHHYTFAVGAVIERLESWRAKKPKAEPFEFVFDWMEKRDPRCIEIRNLMDFAEYRDMQQGIPTRFSNYSFRHRCDVAGLQCVDPLAWSSFQWALKHFRDTPVKEYAKLISRNFRPEWWQVQTATKENIRDWYARELADGRSLKDWEAWRKHEAAAALSRHP